MMVIARKMAESLSWTENHDLINFLDLHMASFHPILANENNTVSWKAVRSLITDKPTPWFWAHISYDDGKFTAWDETGANKISTYTEYKRCVEAILQYADYLHKDC